MIIGGYHNIALVSEVPELPLADLTPVAAALQIQVQRDFFPIWNRIATVAAFDPKKIPHGFWPIRIQANIGDPNAAGFHTDANNQPFALIAYAPDWPLTASHECLEMILDPWGNWLTPTVRNGQSILVLREACDPCEDFSYQINGVTVSDFVKRGYYTAAVPLTGSYSFMGILKHPLEVVTNGYLSWLDPATNHWFQETYFGGVDQVVDLGPNSKEVRQGKALREWVDEQSRKIHPKKR